MDFSQKFWVARGVVIPADVNTDTEINEITDNDLATKFWAGRGVVTVPIKINQRSITTFEDDDELKILNAIHTDDEMKMQSIDELNDVKMQQLIALAHERDTKNKTDAEFDHLHAVYLIKENNKEKSLERYNKLMKEASEIKKAIDGELPKPAQELLAKSFL